MEKKVFCPHCNQDALTYSVVRDGKEELCCLYCGLLLERQESSNFSTLAKTTPEHKSIVYADDSPFMRDLLTDIFFQKKEFVSSFAAFDSGESLIYHITRSFIEKKSIDLIILDIRMPHLTGIGAANAIRAIEKAFGIKAIPFLFFSAKQADEELKKLIEHTSPAYFINKGASSNIEELEKRLTITIRSILNI